MNHYAVQKKKDISALLVAFVVVVIYAVRTGTFLLGTNSRQSGLGYSLLLTKIVVLEFVLLSNTFRLLCKHPLTVFNASVSN